MKRGRISRGIPSNPVEKTTSNRAARALFQAISAASVLCAVQRASAQSAQLYWDPNGTSTGAATASSFAAGTWNSTNSNWNTAQAGTSATTTWTAGSVATFSAGSNATGPFTVTVAGTQVFGGMNTANGVVTLAPGTGGILSYAPTDDPIIWSTASALTINVPIVEDPTATVTDSLINFFGTGTTTGAVTLGASNSFTNSIKVGAGGLTITNSNALGDNTGTTLVSSSSTINVALTFSGGINSPENIFLSGGTLNGSAASNITSGTITLRNGLVPDGISPASGGTLTLTGLLLDGSQPQFFKTGAGTVVLTGTSSYGGNLVINNGTFLVQGTGSIANNISLINVAGTLTAAGTLAVTGTGKVAATNNTGITIGIQANETTFSAGVSTPLLAAFTLDKSGTLSNDNIDDNSTITLGGGSAFNLIGNASASSETMGNLNILGGQDGRFVGNNFVNATGGAGLMTLTASSLVRGAGGLAVFRGPNLGGTSGANAVQIKFSSTPTMLGGGGGNGTPTISIIPGVLADNVITTNAFFSNINTSAGLGSGFATYDGTVGLRALTANEYSSSFAANNNVSISAPANVSSSTTINSLILNGPGATVTVGGTLGVTSGMIMSGTSASGNVGISGGAIDFQGNEAIVVNRTAMTISSNLGNANGFTKQGLGTLTLTGSGANLHGSTYLEEGATVITSGDGLGDGRTSVAPGAALELSGGQTPISVNHTVAIGGYFNAVNGAAFGLPGSADIVNGNGSTGGNIGALESLSGNNTINANVELTGGGLTGDPLNNPGNNIGNNGLNSIGVAAGSSLTIGGAINATSGPGSFVKVGDGTLVLTHADSMPGVVRLWGGVINAQADQALGGSPSTAVNVGFVAFLLNSRSTIGFSNNVKYISKDRDFTQMTGNGAGTLGIIDNFGGTNRFDANLTTQIARIGAFDILQPTYIGSQAGTLTLNGIFNSGGNTTPRLLIKLGAGTIDLANNINFGGQTEIQNGGFILGSNGSGDATGFGKFSTGGLDVSQPNWLSVFSSAALVIDDTGTPGTVANLGAQRFGGGSGEKVFLMGSEFKLIGNNAGPDGFGLPSTGTNAFTIIGSTTLTVSQPTGGAQTILQLNHARPANGFTLLVRGASLGGTPGALDNEITDTVAPTLVGAGGTGSSISIVPWAFGDNSETGGGSDLVTYGANGFRPLAAAANEYETSGLPGNDQNLNYKITSDQTPITDSGVNAIVVNNANLNLGNTTLTVKSGAVLMASGSGIGATSINGGTLAFGSAEGIIYTGAGHDTTISSTITGSNGLTKSGPAALTLTASSSFSGPVSLNGGTLIVDNDNELGNATNPVNMSSGVLQPTAAYTSTPRNFTLNSKSGGFDIEGNQSFTIAGTIASSATFTPLVKTGTGTLVLSPPTSNTWIGGTIIRSGTLRVASDSALGSNSTAAANNDTTANPGSAIPLQIDGGTLSFSDNTSLGQRAVFLGKSNGTISVDAGKTVTFDTPTGSLDSNIIAFFGPGELFKDGAGTFEIRGSTLTFNGGADIRNGTLKMDTANALLSNTSLLSRVVRVDGGTLLFNTTNTATAGFVQLGTNGTLAALNSGTYGVTALAGYPNVEPGANVTLSDVTAGGVFTIVTQMSNMDPSNVAGTTVNIRGAGTTYLLNQPYANFVASFNIDGSTLRLTNADAALGVQTNPVSFSAAGGTLEMRETVARNYAYPVTLNGNGTFIESTTSTTTFVGVTNTLGALNVAADSTLTSTNISGATNGVTSGNVGLVFPSASLGANLTVNVLNPTVGGGSGSVAIGTTGGAGISETVAGRTLTKTGPGNLTLLGSATYTGATNLQAGTLTMVGAPAWSPVLSGPGGAVLTGGRMVFDYTSNPASDPATTGQIQAILNQTAFAAHFASGQIRTSPAADNLHAIGWIDDTTNKQVRVAYTFAGDANVDGKVTTSDFTLLAQNFNVQTGAVWAQGDFDYNGKVDSNDFNAIAVNFGGAIPGTPVDGGAVDGGAVALGALVPEPSAIAMLAIGAASLARRRRR